MKKIDFKSNKEYFVSNNKHKIGYHRIGMPAIEYNSGAEEWYFNDKFHKINGKTYKDNGNVIYYCDDLLYNKRINLNIGKLVI